MALRLALALALGTVNVASPRPASAAQVPTDFVDEPIVSGLVQVVNFDFLPDGRVLVVERGSAKIRLVVGNALSPIDPVTVVPEVETMSLEQGLLGVAVDPGWPNRPYVYVYYTYTQTPNIRLTRFTATGDLDFSSDGALSIDLASRREILADIPDDNPLHNGGTIEFGPDGYLYVASGEDGIPCAAQDIHSLRGKILRLDVSNVPDGPGPAPAYQDLAPPDNPFVKDFDPRARLVWLYGLRNPFSFDFDRNTGALGIADVGNSTFEEVDHVTSGGLNLGWPLYEGPFRFEFPCVYDDTLNLEFPVYWYRRFEQVEAAAIFGGIYRRPPGPPAGYPASYSGNLFVLDFYDGLLRRLAPLGDGNYILAPPAPGQPSDTTWATGLEFVTRMRVGPDGTLWYFQWDTIRRIRYTGNFNVGVDPGTRVEPRLERLFPNPARGEISIVFELPEGATSRLEIHDARGRRVRTIDTGSRGGGRHVVAWDGRTDHGDPAAPGVYFASLRADRFEASRRFVLLPRDH
ncbi:MAG: PQQ-dependent sugar dehydrogenase [Candidatus Eiseniibacteriota bacterium]